LITEIFDELHFKIGGIDKVHILAMEFFGTVFGNRKARIGATLDCLCNDGYLSNSY
jgi:hypothetical protein